MIDNYYLSAMRYVLWAWNLAKQIIIVDVKCIVILWILSFLWLLCEWCVDMIAIHHFMCGFILKPNHLPCYQLLLFVIIAANMVWPRNSKNGKLQCIDGKWESPQCFLIWCSPNFDCKLGKICRWSTVSSSISETESGCTLKFEMTTA